ncbi:MAG: S-ribosylhomocysteine lyase [Duncaniella sp.]|nr:S-ribosylhomocysteine lyase [Duncaniella sp.]
MEKIASFTIDHERLLRGIYVSRRDLTPAGDVITTFDIRMTEPNRQPAMTPRSLHAMEHLAATYLRNRPDWRDRVVYWGPMGCCTGNYLLMQGKLESADIVDLIRDTMEFVAGYEGEIPGASARDCGNYTFMDIDSARRDARRYIDEVLDRITPDNLNYPQ